MLFHAGVTWMPGGYVGVDVFFVISGYLITGILLTEAQRTQRIDLKEFYARRARRLLPLSALSLLSSLAVGAWLLPALDRGALVADVRAAALYVANWRFAQQAADYFAGGVEHSWLLHYWSLAIEEQFYLVWPLLIIGAVKLARTTDPRRITRALTLALGALGGLSFLGSALFTAGLGVAAYFGTHLRIWELAIGAGLALSRERIPRLSRGAADALAIGGAIAIAFAALRFDGSTVMPGVAALVPTLGAAAILGSGAAHRTAIANGLAAGPFPLIGRLSYAWYLWHWPALVIAGRLWTRNEWTTPLGLALTVAVLGSLLLSWVTHHLVEKPARFAPSLKKAPKKTLALGALLTLIPVAASAAVITTDRATVPGDAAIAMTPAEARADDNRARLGTCMQPTPGVTVNPACLFGDLEATTTVALIGDSHAMHWFPAFEAAALANGWRLGIWTKTECTAVDARVWSTPRNNEYTACATWRKNLRAHLSTLDGLEAIVIGRARGYIRRTLDAEGVRSTAETFPPLWEAANVSGLRALTAITPRVAILRDTPYPPEDVPSCIADHLDDPSRCDFPAADNTDVDALLFGAERRADVPGVRFIDLEDRVCGTPTCPVVTPEGIIIYRDDDHMTGTFVATLAEDIGAAIRRLLG